MLNTINKPKSKCFVHDLLWVSQLNTDSAPDWLDKSAIKQRPVVVRRAPKKSGMLAVGVRGNLRHQRLAAYVCPEHIIKTITPQALVDTKLWQQQQRLHPLPHWQFLADIDRFCRCHNIDWGITGSLGFELATQIITANKNSDIDATIAAPNRPHRTTFLSLVKMLQSLPIRVDIQLETPAGGVGLNEWLYSKTKVLLKTQKEPLLVADPWDRKSENPCHYY